MAEKTYSPELKQVLRAGVPSKQVWIYRGFLCLTFLVYVLVSLGGIVRNAGAGLSCPDWPLCFGQLIPAELTSIQVFLEWFHRLVAGVASTSLLGLSSIVFFDAQLKKRVGKYCVLAIGFLALQVVLGGLTVIGLLSPKWVVSHLAVGIAFFSTLLWITLQLKEFNTHSVDRAQSNRTGYIMACVVFSIIYVQIILGGIVSSNYAGLACPDFPTCFGKWIPDQLSSLILYQFKHRVGALVSTLALAGFLLKYRLRLKKAGQSILQISFFLIIQILLGVGMIHMKIPLLMSVAHLAVAVALLGSILVVVHAIRYS